MEFSIAAQEGPQPADSNQFVIRTRVPFKEITDQMLIHRCRAANLCAGDLLLVQCYNHEYNTLLHEAEFRVVSRHEEIKTVSLNDRDIKSYNEIQLAIARKHPWWATPAGAAADAAEEELLGSVDSEIEVQWNPGKKVFQVFRGGEMVAEDRDKVTALELATAKAA